jgi:hypothetical protein
MYASFGSMLILIVSSRLLLAVECKTIGNRRRRDDFQTIRMVTTQIAVSSSRAAWQDQHS